MRVREPIPRKYRYDRLGAEGQLYFRNGAPGFPSDRALGAGCAHSAIFDPSQIAKKAAKREGPPYPYGW
jgi:hypothetical protein